MSLFLLILMPVLVCGLFLFLIVRGKPSEIQTKVDGGLSALLDKDEDKGGP